MLKLNLILKVLTEPIVAILLKRKSRWCDKSQSHLEIKKKRKELPFGEER